MTDELRFPDGVSRFNNFEHGQIAWSPTLGAAVSASTYQPAGGGIRPQGLGGNGMPEVRRRLVCVAHLDVTDHESLGSNEHSSADRNSEVVLTSSVPQELIRLSDGAGGEVKVELRIDAQLTVSGDVRVVGQALLFEGRSENSDDQDGDEPIQFLVPRDDFTSRSYTVNNEDEGGDSGVITLTVSNFAV